MTRLNIFAAILLFTTLTSCNQSGCQNTNPVFEKHTPDSKEYQHELAKQLNTNIDTNTTYTFNGYIESNEQTYLIIGIVSDSICAEGYMHVTDWNGPIEEIQRTKGMGYNGAELNGLKYTINKDGTLMFKSVDDITD